MLMLMPVVQVLLGNIARRSQLRRWRQVSALATIIAWSVLATQPSTVSRSLCLFACTEQLIFSIMPAIQCLPCCFHCLLCCLLLSLLAFSLSLSSPVFTTLLGAFVCAPLSRSLTSSPTPPRLDYSQAHIWNHFRLYQMPSTCRSARYKRSCCFCRCCLFFLLRLLQSSPLRQRRVNKVTSHQSGTITANRRRH